MTTTILSFDVGGTKTAIGAFEASGSKLSVLQKWSVSSRSFESFVPVYFDAVERFRKDVDLVAIGVAGPVIANKVSLTNLDWQIDGEEMSEAAGCPVFLLNDLEAMANGVPGLKVQGTAVLQKGKAQKANRVVLAAGTGLGEGILHWTGKDYLVSPSEGSHGDFAPGSKEDFGLLEFLMNRYGHVSWERVVSGKDGFRNLFDWFCHRDLCSKALIAKVGDVQDVGPILMEAAEEGDDGAAAILTRFGYYYGAEAGNLALKALATGGVYLGGGVTPALLPWMRKGRSFKTGFCNKGRFSDLMESIPVYVIRDEDISLKGAATYAMKQRSS